MTQSGWMVLEALSVSHGKAKRLAADNRIAARLFPFHPGR